MKNEQITLWEIDNNLSKLKPKLSNDWKWKFSDYPKKNGLKCFSCFACGGGSTMGYKLAGVEVIGDLEIDPKMNEIYKLNHNPKLNYLMDIRDFNKLENLPEELYNLDVLDGSPPCTTFSMAGDREKSWGVKKKFAEGQAEQTLDDLVFEFVKTIGKLKPKVAILENVEGLLKGAAYEYVRGIHSKLKEIGYECRHYLLKGEEMGIPQKRHRVFFIATKKELNFDYSKLDMSFNYEPITYGEIKDCIGNKATGKGLELLKNCKTDENCLDKANMRLYNKSGWFQAYVVDEDTIMNTFRASIADVFDRKELSRISWQTTRNAATFPQDYNFNPNSSNNVGYICGMSVPPLMIKRIVDRLIRSGIFDYKLNN